LLLNVNSNGLVAIGQTDLNGVAVFSSGLQFGVPYKIVIEEATLIANGVANVVSDFGTQRLSIFSFDQKYMENNSLFFSDADFVVSVTGFEYASVDYVCFQSNSSANIS
jgi:hypothetical protein